MAWFATVEAETMTRVSFHWVSVIQVHGLGDGGCARGSQEEGEVAAVVEVMAGEEQDKKVRCRWDISLVYNPPIGMTFSPQNIHSHYQSRVPPQMLFCSDLQKSYYLNQLQTLMLLFH